MHFLNVIKERREQFHAGNSLINIPALPQIMDIFFLRDLNHIV